MVSSADLPDPSNIDFLCPHCGEKSLKPLGELIENLAVSCGCGSEIIDISTQEWRAFIETMADIIQQITMLPLS